MVFQQLFALWNNGSQNRNPSDWDMIRSSFAVGLTLWWYTMSFSVSNVNLDCHRFNNCRCRNQTLPFVLQEPNTSVSCLLYTSPSPRDA